MRSYDIVGRVFLAARSYDIVAHVCCIATRSYDIVAHVCCIATRICGIVASSDLLGCDFTRVS